MTVTKREIFQLLDSKGISYRAIAHKAVYTIREMDQPGLENMESIAKNLFVRDDKKRQYFLLVLKKEKRLDLKRVVVLIDAEFKGQDIGIHPNENTATIWIRAEELFCLIKQFGNSVEWAEF